MDNKLGQEAAWWGDCTNTADEEAKQSRYAAYMGLEQAYRVKNQGWFAPPFDLRGKSVLDIGGGPVSLLLKCVNRGRSVVVDPIAWPEWVHERYRAAGINYIQSAAEDVSSPAIGSFDEVWIYNCLQHVKDPAAVLAMARKVGRLIRIFEWLDTEVNEMHPHSLTKEFLDDNLFTNGEVVQIDWERYVPKAYTAVVQFGHPIFRFHLLGLAHIPTHRAYSSCAYTQKVVKLAAMLRSLGHQVIFYGGEGSAVECDEFVQVVSGAEREACYGVYDWQKEFFKHDGNDAAYTAFNKNAILEIGARKKPGDFILFPMGNYNKPVADAHGDLFCVESGIGYRGVFSKYRVFESYTWMSHVYGLLNQGDGSWYDAVIPNQYDPADFPYQENKKDYALFVGRLVYRKGLTIAVETTRELGIPLIVAGQGSLINPAEGLNITDKHVTHVGSVGPEERARLMGEARMVFVPTIYIEPFGGVAVEAQLCGAPVITTDWGVFSETVVHGKTGFRCRTFDDFLWAAKHIDQINPLDCRSWAIHNYSMDRVRWMYQEYFEKLADLSQDGWYERHPERTQLDWLRRYPV